jgi:ABC-2 type transport system permease protein
MTLIFLLISRLVGNTSTNVLIYNPGGSNVAKVVTNAFQNLKVSEANTAAEVEAAFGPNGAKVKTMYAAGLIIPAGFDDSIRAGTTPPMTLFVNQTQVGLSIQTLVEAAIQNYGRMVAVPNPTINLLITVINPKPPSNAGVELGQIYSSLVLLLSLIIGTTFVPQLIIEEKERKTLRMLMITPASFEDVMLAKLIVVLVYQVALTSIAVGIQGGFSGQVGWMLLFIFLGACFSLSLGLLFGAIFNTVGAASAIESIVIVIYIVAGIFVGPLGELIGKGPVITIARFLPTYYIAEGAYNAAQRIGTVSSNLLDVGVVLGTTIILFAVSAWILRRQAAVAAII